MGKATSGLRVAALASAGAIALAACGGGSGGGSGGSGGSSAGGAGSPQKGGTLTFLTQSQQLQHLDPQRNYTG
jgi:peptide/nickel transport system substrate-binding protein